ncbi:hypothetical protein GCM10009737_10070 [Nocardioides lentus]|uniref:UVR domain-containing protein n=1 Tax=Nocardioides lentus TaxID=338077 RepID=A0ABN2P6B9_9ACTN
MPDDGERMSDLLGALAAGNFVRSSGDPNEAERLRRERVAAREDFAVERARAARLRGLG